MNKLFIYSNHLYFNDYVLGITKRNPVSQSPNVTPGHVKQSINRSHLNKNMKNNSFTIWTEIANFSRLFLYARRLVGIFCFFFFLTPDAIGQGSLQDRKVSLQLTGVPIADVLRALEDKTGASFSYSNTNLETSRIVSIDFRDLSLRNALKELLGSSFGEIVVKGNVISIQASGSVKGSVKTSDGKPASFATIVVSGHIRKGNQSDAEGLFAFENLPAGKYTITASLVGYESQHLEIEVTSKQTREIQLVLSPSGALSEVVITASRVAESIDKIPSSVTILNAAQIEQQTNINNSISEILGFTVPGLGPSTNKATNSGQTLRGRSVLVLIDGIPQSTPLMNGNRDIRSLDPAIIERVEIIKGATSIYGNGSGGGIINYITKSPDTRKKIAGQTTLGGNGHPLHFNNSQGYRFSQMLHGTLDKFSYAVSGTYNYTGVFKDAEGNVLAQEDGLTQSHATNIFAKASYRISPSSDFTVSYSFFRSLQETDYVNVPGVYGEKPAIGVKGTNPGAPAGTPQNHNILATYRQSSLPLNSSLEIAGYFHRFLSTNRYVERASGWYGPGQTQISSRKKGIRLNFNTPWKTGILDGHVTYGLDLLGDITHQPLLDGRIYVPDMNMANIAPFIQLKTDLWDYLVLKGGLRYENARVKVADYRTLPTGPDGEGSISVTGGTIDYRATMFNAGLRFTKFGWLNPFVSFSQAFGLNELGRILRAADENTLSMLQTDPIITNNYEAGFNSRFSIVNLTGAFFISTSELGANLVANASGTMLPERAPERVYGYEFTADASVNKALALGFTYAYVEGKSKMEDGSKKYLGYARIAPPKATGYLRYAPIDKLNLQLFWVYTGRRDRFDRLDNGTYRSGEGAVEPIHLFNFNSSYQLNPAFKLSLGVENLFNNAYYTFYSQYSARNERYSMGNGMKANLNLTFSF